MIRARAGSTKPVERFEVLSEVKKGDFIKRNSSGKVYVKGGYVRDWGTGDPRYSCTNADDMNIEVFWKPDMIVWVGFTY